MAESTKIRARDKAPRPDVKIKSSNWRIRTKDKPDHCQGCRLYKANRGCLDGGPNTDILFISGFPIKDDLTSPFSSNGGTLVKDLMQKLTQGLPMNEQLKRGYGYAVQCVPDQFDYKLKKEDIDHCSGLLCMQLDKTKPRLVIAMGADAMKALNIMGTMSDMRGNFTNVRLDGLEDVPALVTLHPVQVIKSPGYFKVLENDLQKAVDYCTCGIDVDEFDIRIPVTFDEVIRELKVLEDLLDAQGDGPKIALAVDTETTGLRAHNPAERMIAASLSYADGVGIAFPWKHKEVEYSDEQMRILHVAFERVLNHEKTYMVMHHGKFDIQWLYHKESLKLRMPLWDTQLVEHLLDEDKSGEYSLKDLTSDYFPASGKYERELKQALTDKQAEINAKYKEEVALWNGLVQEEWLNYWLKLTQDEMDSLAIRINRDGWLTMEQARILSTPDFKKRRKNMTDEQYYASDNLKKAYLNKIGKLFLRVPLEEYVGELITDLEPPADSPRAVTFEDIDIQVMLNYAAIDAIMTRKIMVKQMPRFTEDWHRIQDANVKHKEYGWSPIATKKLSSSKNEIMAPMSHLLSEMEYNGVRLDRERLDGYIEELDHRIEESKETLFREAGDKINPNAPAEISDMLFKQLGLKPIKYSDTTGEPSVDADTIKQLSDQNPEMKVLNALLVYRKLKKVQNTYLRNWRAMSDLDGWLHGRFNQNIAATYRLSSNSPNLQNVPFYLDEANMNLKALFIPDSDEYDLYDLDISNAEMRILCAYSQDETLIEAFLTGKDMHSLTASGISEYSYEDIVANKEDKSTPQFTVRQIGKKVNFGTIFCQGALSLSQQLWSDMRIVVTEEEAAAYLNNFFETYPGVYDYIEGTKALARKDHFVTTFTGRRRRFPMLPFVRRGMNRMLRQAVNARIQTTSSDVVQLNMLDLDRAVKPLGGRLILTVHDSVVFQLPKGTTGVKEILDETILTKTAERCPWLPVPWKYDCQYGPSYGEAKLEV